MSVSKLKQYAKSINLIDSLGKDTVSEIAQQVMAGYDEDLNSMSEWLSDIKRIEALVSLESVKKTAPLPNSANIKWPLITKACYEFASRVIPEIIKDDQIIKIRPVGVRPSEAIKLAANRSETFLNWQMLLQSSDWAEQMTRLVFRLAIIGFLCKKTFYDPVRKKIVSELCNPDELIINSKVKSIEDASRISHKITWHLNTLVEKANKTIGEITVFCKETVKELQDLHKDDRLDVPIEGIEQCIFLDLDKDGYKEPYVATISVELKKLLRLVAQYDTDSIVPDVDDKVCYIDREEYYEDFHFLANPKGHFQSVGFGILLLYLTETANSTANALLDSAQLSNMKGGFMDARCSPIKKGQTRHTPGEFQLVRTEAGMPLKDGILPFEFGEPSSVLLQLLQLLFDVCRDLTSSAEINNGTQSSANAKTGATLALQEEGRKSSTLINKGIYRSLTKDFKHRFKLNSKYLTNKEYRNILNDELADVNLDFNITNFDVIPTADPNLASSQQKMQDLGILDALSQKPGWNPIKIQKLIADRISIPGIKDCLLTEKDSQNAPPNPEMLKLQHSMESDAAKTHIEERAIEIQDKEVMIKASLAQAQIAEIKANSILLLAKAGSEEQKTQIAQFQAQLAAISKQMDTELGMAKILHEKDQQQNDHIQEAQSQLYDQQHQQDMQSSDQQHQQDIQQTQIDNTPAPSSDEGTA